MSTVSGPAYPPAGSRPLSQASALARSPPSTASSTADRTPLGLDAAARSISSSSSTLTLRPGTTSTGQAGPAGGLRTPSNRKTIYDRNLNRSRNAELSKSSFAYLFSEMVVYAQRRVTGIQDLERRLSEQGYTVGLRLLSLLTHRSLPTSSSSSSATQRPTRIIPLMQFLTTQLWRALFNRQADSLERSATKANEYMLADNDPLTSQFVSVPKEMSQFNPGAYIAGIIEGCCDGLGMPAKVSAHNAGTELWPQKTVWLVAFEEGVVKREEALLKAEKDAKR